MTKLISVLDSGEYKDLPTPSEYTVIPNEDSKSQRNVFRNLYKRRLAVKRTITLAWNAVTPAEKNTILTLTYGDDVEGGFKVRYFDIQTSEWREGKFYRGNDLEIKPLVRWDGSEFTAYSISMTLGEF